jgi:mycothiol synthase
MNNILRKIYTKYFVKNKTKEDLEMIFPAALNEVSINTLGDNYSIIIYNENYRSQFVELIEAAGMSGCDIDYWISITLPDGFFLVIEKTSSLLVGACLAAHKPNERNIYGGCLGWLAVHPNHRGNNLGIILSGCVVNKLKASSYRNIYLGTQDFRLSAIKTYLKLGWIPNIYNEEMYYRWMNIYKDLNINFPVEFKIK